MKNMTDKQAEQWDPWVDHPDPGPEDFEEFLSNPDNYTDYRLPAYPIGRVVLIGNEDVNDWLEKRDAAHARGERLPEEIEADERVEAELARRAREALEQLHH